MHKRCYASNDIDVTLIHQTYRHRHSRDRGRDRDSKWEEGRDRDSGSHTSIHNKKEDDEKKTHAYKYCTAQYKRCYSIFIEMIRESSTYNFVRQGFAAIWNFIYLYITPFCVCMFSFFAHPNKPFRFEWESLPPNCVCVYYSRSHAKTHIYIYTYVYAYI